MNAGIFGLESASTIKRDYLGLSYGVAAGSVAAYYPNSLPLDINNLSPPDNTYSIICNEMSSLPLTSNGSSGYRIFFAISNYSHVFSPLLGNDPIFINWGDGSVTNYGVGSTNLSIIHTYSTPGPYIIKASGRNISWIGRNLPSLTSITHVLSFPSTILSLFGTFRGQANNIQVIAPLPRSVKDLGNAFLVCNNFNNSLSHWNTTNITNLSATFSSCSRFNQPLNSWNVSSVTNFSFMFNSCSSFNQDLSSWNFSSCTLNGLNGFMAGVTLNTAHYDALLILWDTFKNTWFNGGTNMNPNMGSSKYSAGAAATARASLITKGWTITDGGPA